MPAPVVVKSRLSPSRASDFLNCPLLFRYRTIDRLPEPASPAMVRGTLVHAVLEDLFDHPAPSRTLELAGDLLPAAWARLRTDERLDELFGSDDVEREAAWLASAVELLSSYFTMENPQDLEPAACEARVEHRVQQPDGSGITLNGIIDRIDIAPDGRIRVVDYKTGKAPGERFEDKALFQMKFYGLVIWRTRGVLPTLLQLMYLADGQVLTHQPTEDELLATERKVTAIWQAVLMALESGEFRPRRSGLCRFCAHQAHCPEFGGTPLPMPVVTLE